MNAYTEAEIERLLRPRRVRFMARRVDWRMPRVLFLRKMRCKTARPDFDITLRIGEYTAKPDPYGWLMPPCLAEFTLTISHVGFCAAPNGVHYWRPIPWSFRLSATVNRSVIREWWSA